MRRRRPFCRSKIMIMIMIMNEIASSEGGGREKREREKRAVVVCVPHTPSEVDERRRPSERSGAQLLNPRPAFPSVHMSQPRGCAGVTRIALYYYYKRERARHDLVLVTRDGDGVMGI